MESLGLIMLFNTSTSYHKPHHVLSQSKFKPLQDTFQASLFVKLFRERNGKLKYEKKYPYASLKMASHFKPTCERIQLPLQKSMAELSSAAPHLYTVYILGISIG
jgi:hypothetical protein